MFNLFKKKPLISKEEAQKEINAMIGRYWEVYPAIGNKYGFLVGSSHCGNKQGDSARFRELKEIINASR